MKKFVLVSLMLVSTLVFAAKQPAPNPADYTIIVHVAASRMQVDVVRCSQRFLSVVIKGKNYEVWAPTKCTDNNGILALGDYKARLVKDQHPTAYQSHQIFEVLLPDNTTMNFNVIGLIE